MMRFSLASATGTLVKAGFAKVLFKPDKNFEY